eukprot:3346941-Alexandrium_andersonii.AAC.1
MWMRRGRSALAQGSSSVEVGGVEVPELGTRLRRMDLQLRAAASSTHYLDSFPVVRLVPAPGGLQSRPQCNRAIKPR